MGQHLLLGQTLSFSGNPMCERWEDVTHHNSEGAVLVKDGFIVSVGTATNLKTQAPKATITDYGNKLIVAGFVDAHVHYPQTAIIASWGHRLIDWLNTYTFPEEMRLNDPSYAAKVATTYFDLALSHGTTTMASYCTSSPVSVDAYFDAAQLRNMRVVGGKTCMDRNAPDGLKDTAQRAYDESKALLEKWHGNGRAEYAITPRFSPTSTTEQLKALGDLWAEHPQCLMQTHISEQIEELAWVKELFPHAPDYLATYEEFGLIGERGLYGHAIHLTESEVGRLAEVGASVVHCPTSNTFIGSGLFDMGLAKRLSVGLATDTGGGSSFCMLHTMAAAYEISQLRGSPLHPSQLMWLASEGSAQSMHLVGTVGHLGKGAEADLCILDLESTAAITQRVENAGNFWETLFPTIMMGDDRAVHAVWVNGKPV